MKIGISSTGAGTESVMDPRFGRCANFVIVDTDSGEVANIPNEAAAAAGGAGIAAATAMAKAGVSAVVTGHVGPNAIRTLVELGIKVHQCAGGTVAQAIEAYAAGQCPELASASVASHAGLGMGPGGGMGGGRGAGGGGGFGAGGGRGAGRGGRR